MIFYFYFFLLIIYDYSAYLFSFLLNGCCIPTRDFTIQACKKGINFGPLSPPKKNELKLISRGSCNCIFFSLITSFFLIFS